MSENYYLNDLALQKRMMGVMHQLIDQYPYTHQGTFGGYAVKARGGENRGTERPNGCREVQPRLGIDYGSCGYGGIVEGDNKYMDFLSYNKPKRKVKKPSLQHDLLSRGVGISGGRKMLPPVHVSLSDVMSNMGGYTEKGPMHKPGLLGAHAGNVSGGKKKKATGWIAFVKKIQKRDGLSYKEAMEQASREWHK